MIETIDWMEIRNIIHTICNSYSASHWERSRADAIDLAIKYAMALSSTSEWDDKKILAVAERFAIFISTGQVFED